MKLDALTSKRLQKPDSAAIVTNLVHTYAHQTSRLTLHVLFLTNMLLFSIAIDWKVEATFSQMVGNERTPTRVT
jgi:hypothetical protein